MIFISSKYYENMEAWLTAESPRVKEGASTSRSTIPSSGTILLEMWQNSITLQRKVNIAIKNQLPFPGLAKPFRLWTTELNFSSHENIGVDRLPQYLLDCKPKHGKRSRDRPRKRLNDVYIEDAELRMNHSLIDRMMSMATDRQGWRKITHQSCIVHRDDTVNAD